MRAKLIPIGNSRGVRLPKPIIEEAQLEEEVEISVRDKAVVIASLKRTRGGWEEAAERLHATGEDGLLMDDVKNAFDEKEWVW